MTIRLTTSPEEHPDSLSAFSFHSKQAGSHSLTPLVQADRTVFSFGKEKSAKENLAPAFIVRQSLAKVSGQSTLLSRSPPSGGAVSLGPRLPRTPRHHNACTGAWSHSTLSFCLENRVSFVFYDYPFIDFSGRTFRFQIRLFFSFQASWFSQSHTACAAGRTVFSFGKEKSAKENLAPAFIVRQSLAKVSGPIRLYSSIQENK